MEWLILFAVIGAVYYFYQKKRSHGDREPAPNYDDILDLKTLFGEKQKTYKRQFKTKIVGVTYDNIDGSSRQDAIRRARRGQRIQLAWNPADPYDANAGLVFCEGSMEYLEMDDCMGHIKADLAADIVEWVKTDKYKSIYAEVADVLGGSRKFPTLGCLIEITLS